MSVDQCPECGSTVQVDDLEYEVCDHGLCWPCASSKLDEVLDDLRSALTRAVVAEQWAVAIAVVSCTLTKSDGTPTDPDDQFANVWIKCLATVQRQLAEFCPSAAAVVAERMGEP